MAQLQTATREERFVGTADVPNFFRRAYGPGWALVGDAGYHRDSTWGHGIGDAFRQAEYLVDAINEADSGHATLDEALARYETRRDEALLPYYEAITEVAPMEPPPPEAMAVIAALVGNDYQTGRFIGMVEDIVSPEEFFSPENVAQIMAEAAQPEQLAA